MNLFACSFDFNLSSLLPAITAAIIGLCQLANSIELKKRDEYLALRNRLESILAMTITYPDLENPTVTEHWKENRLSEEERFMRYDQFCNIVFNFLEDVFLYYKGDTEKIEKFIDVQSWVELHKQNWLYPRTEGENFRGYDYNFYAYINSLLK